jgi:hypothetical protein
MFKKSEENGEVKDKTGLVLGVVLVILVSVLLYWLGYRNILQISTHVRDNETCF